MQNYKDPLMLRSIIIIAVIMYSIPLNAADAQPGQIHSILPNLQGYIPLYPAEVFGPDRLYEKINGQAELYLSAGFVSLRSQWFSESENPDSMVEIYIYHMGDGLNAFSVFSRQRRGDGQKLGFAPFAYQTKNALYMFHGPYYVEMISMVPSETVLSKLIVLAKQFITDNPVDRRTIEGLGFFPQENLDSESITMIAKNAFGFKLLDRVFTATYSSEEGSSTAFISRRKTPQKAKRLALQFFQYFTTYGGKEIEPDVTVKGAKMVEIMDRFIIIFSLNTYVAGIYEAPTISEAQTLTERLVQKIRQRFGEK